MHIYWSHQHLQQQRKSPFILLEGSGYKDLSSDPLPSWTVFSVTTEQLSILGFPFAHTIYEPGSLVFIGE